MANASRESSADWAWPRLIDSLQRDIARLHESVEGMRQESVAAREQHRRELDILIGQLRDVRSQLDPIISERASTKSQLERLRWAWIERAGWVGIGVLALVFWEYVTRHMNK
jgi:hypothetical protein